MLAVLIWRFDQERLRKQHILLAAAPYVFFGILWSFYIAQSPRDFSAQFFANAAGRDGSRLMVILQPWLAVWYEFLRHVATYVLSNLWSGSVNQAFILVPLFYFASLFAFFLNRKTYSPNVTTFLFCVLIMLLAMTFLNGFKAPMYLIYILPLYNAVLAFELLSLWRSGPIKKFAAVAAGCLFVAVQVSASIEHLQADEYHRYYEPTIALLKQEQSAGRTIVGTAALGFGLGFHGFEDDWRLGKYSHLDPDVIAVDRAYRGFAKAFEEKEPGVFSHIVSILTTRYRLREKVKLYLLDLRTHEQSSRHPKRRYWQHRFTKKRSSSSISFRTVGALRRRQRN